MIRNTAGKINAKDRNFFKSIVQNQQVVNYSNNNCHVP